MVYAHSMDQDSYHAQNIFDTLSKLKMYLDRIYFIKSNLSGEARNTSQASHRETGVTPCEAR